MRLVGEEPACEDFFYNFFAYAFLTVNVCQNLKSLPNYFILLNISVKHQGSDDVLNYLLASSSTGIAAVGERFGAVSEQAKNQNWHL